MRFHFLKIPHVLLFPPPPPEQAGEKKEGYEEKIMSEEFPMDPETSRNKKNMLFSFFLSISDRISPVSREPEFSDIARFVGFDTYFLVNFPGWGWLRLPSHLLFISSSLPRLLQFFVSA